MGFLQLEGVSLHFGERTILDEVSLNLDSGVKAALCGRNGSGKSCLLKVLSKELAVDNGKINSSPSLVLAYLAQQSHADPENTVLQEAVKGYDRFAALEDRLHQIHDELAIHPEDTLLASEHEKVFHAIMDGGYYEREKNAAVVLNRLGFGQNDLNRKIREFSSGFQMRAALGRTLLCSPDFLLLDEPTNYLDLETIQWLRGFLQNASYGFLIVSHDRKFLDTTVTEVLEIRDGAVKKFAGNYSAYEKASALLIEQEKAAREKQSEQREKMQAFVDKFRYNASKASMVQSRIKALEKLPDIEDSRDTSVLKFRIPSPPDCSKDVILTENLGKSWGSKNVFQNAALEIHRGEKCAVTGINGAGKTTLLNILGGKVPADQGTVKYGARVQAGFFSQASLDSMTGKNVYDFIAQSASHLTESRIRGLLGAFLFSGDDTEKKLDVLSGGEKTRLCMLKMLLSPVNLLVLDEPTNHLDIHSKDALLTALKDYEGTVVFVSHDEYFIEQLADRIFHIENGKVEYYPGDYGYFRYRKSGSSAPDQVKSVSGSPSVAQTESGNDYEARKKAKNRLGTLKRKSENLLDQIHALEQKEKELHAQLALEVNYSDPAKASALQKQIEEAQENTLALFAEWEESELEISRIS